MAEIMASVERDIVQLSLLAQMVSGAIAANQALGYLVTHLPQWSAEVEPEFGKAALRYAGVPCEHLVMSARDARGRVERLSLARRGVALWVSRAGKNDDREWWDLDICPTHPSCALKWTEYGVLLAMWRDIAPFWTGHALVTEGKVRLTPEEQLGQPFLN